jgi:predicted TIM-barrel fold metal-dependent hydrolase
VNVDDLILVSVDDHVIEPAHLFEGRLPKKYREAAPRLVRRDDGTAAWLYQGQELVNVALNAVAGRPLDEYGFEPTSMDEIRPGCYDIHARVKDMDAGGVLGSLCFASFPGYVGKIFLRSNDHDEAAAMVRAYNDWHIDEWCGTYPGRFIPLALPMMWDPEGAAEELHRVAKKGCHAVSFSSNPYALGLPSLYDEHWDPFWAACVDEGIVPCMHIGSSSTEIVSSPDAPAESIYSLSPINIIEAATDMVWSPMFRKFPELRVALSEGGIGWVPYFLERINYIYRHTQHWSGMDLGGKEPSEVFNDHVIMCFIDDAFGLESRQHMNIDNITWESDYPHADTTWPRGPEMLMDELTGLSDDEIHKITHLNAMRHYQYDPFAHIAREKATVGGLRARAADWDVSIRSGAELRQLAAAQAAG